MTNSYISNAGETIDHSFINGHNHPLTINGLWSALLASKDNNAPSRAEECMFIQGIGTDISVYLQAKRLNITLASAGLLV